MGEGHSENPSLLEEGFEGLLDLRLGEAFRQSVANEGKNRKGRGN